MKKEFGYLREHSKIAEKEKNCKITGLHKTGLDVYLREIFPDVDWVYDKTIPNSNSKKRPDYRCEELKMIVEFDGIHHYMRKDIIQRDIDNTLFYESLGYNVIRIPFFIQLDREAISLLFNKDMELFEEGVPSLYLGGIVPSDIALCGLRRMAKEFKKFPNQFKTNIKELRKNPKETLVNEFLILIKEI